MRIIDGKDYYDSASAYGIDPGIVFVRKPFDLTKGDMNVIGYGRVPEFFLRPKDFKGSYSDEYDFRRGILDGLKVIIGYRKIIFCGKLYCGIVLDIHTDQYSIRDVHTQHVFWSQDKFESFIDGKGWETSGAGMSWTKASFELDNCFAVHSFTGDSLSRLIELGVVMAAPTGNLNTGRSGWSSNKLNDLDEPTGWVANSDKLKEFEFQKAFDPVSAFQEIAQWVGGTLSSAGPDTVTITDDVVKAHKAGFDKWSFRKKSEKSK